MQRLQNVCSITVHRPGLRTRVTYIYRSQYPVVYLRLYIHTSRPSHGYTACRELTVYGPGPASCHSVVVCTVARVEENVYNSCGLTESLVYSLETFQRMHSRAVPCHACHGQWPVTAILVRVILVRPDQNPQKIRQGFRSGGP